MHSSTNIRADTSECKSYHFKHEGTTIHLIDTPGFDDTTKTSTAVLRDIAGWLQLAYSQHIRLNGLVYLHPVNETRMKGSAMTTLRMFKKLTGLENMGSVVLVTTMWDKTPIAEGEAREGELLQSETFWGQLIDANAKVRRFQNTRDSAIEIISCLRGRHKKRELKLQQELAANQSLEETSAGRELNSEMNQQAAQYKREIKELRAEMEKARQEGNDRDADELLKAQKDMQQKMDDLVRNQQELVVKNEQLLKEKEEQLKKALDDAQKIRSDHEIAIKAHADEIKKMHENAAREKESLKAQQEEAEEAMKHWHDDFVDQAAGLFGMLDEHYKEVYDQQRRRNDDLREALARQRNDYPPPPYEAGPSQHFPMMQQQAPPPPPQVVYQAPNPQNQQDMMNAQAFAGAAAAGGVGLGTVAALSMCSVM